MAGKLFSELGLSPELLRAIDNLGFEQASPIQAEAIPLLMQGQDVVGQSMTGSGKTAAFAVPAIEKVDVNQKAPQVLVLCPTRELAVQVSEEVHKLTLFKRGVHALPIYGGQSYELTVQLGTATDDVTVLAEAFHREHERLYGFRDSEAPIELGTARLAVIGRVAPVVLPELATSDEPPMPRGRRRIYLETGWTETLIFERSDLRAGQLALPGRPDAHRRSGPRRAAAARAAG